MKNLKQILTEEEFDCLRHRLEIPDCIADCFEENIHAREDVLLVCSFLRDGDIESALHYSICVTHDVLADAVEGSTWYSCAIAEVSDGELRRIGKVGQSLAKRIGKLICRKLTFPLY